MTIAICAIICGAEKWTQVQEYGKVKQDWFKQFLELPNGIPSHDTFGRIFATIAPDQFQKAFRQWTKAICSLCHGSVAAVDGKTLRRSHDKSNDKAAIHLVSAWNLENQMVLGQIKTDEKSVVTGVSETVSIGPLMYLSRKINPGSGKNMPRKIWQ